MKKITLELRNEKRGSDKEEIIAKGEAIKDQLAQLEPKLERRKKNGENFCSKFPICPTRIRRSEKMKPKIRKLKDTANRRNLLSNQKGTRN